MADHKERARSALEEQFGDRALVEVSMSWSMAQAAAVAFGWANDGPEWSAIADAWEELAREKAAKDAGAAKLEAAGDGNNTTEAN